MIDDSEVQALRQQLRGTLLQPADASYDAVTCHSHAHLTTTMPLPCHSGDQTQLL